jgi:methionine-rich copper-binding protein CopC
MKPTAILAVVLLGAPLGTLPVLAHSELKQTNPRDGAVLAAPPSLFEMVFNEPVQLTFVQVQDSAQRAVTLPELRDLQSRTRETIQLPALAPGAWRVQWRAISADGHPVGGIIRFTIRSEGEVAR